MYDLRMSENFQDLRYNFTNCTQVRDDDVIFGNLSNPETSGSTESFVIRAANSSTTFVEYVYAVRVIDSSGNISPTSNLLKVEFYQIELPTGSSDGVGVLIGVSIGLGLIGQIVSTINKQKRKQKNQVIPLTTNNATESKQMNTTQHR